MISSNSLLEDSLGISINKRASFANWYTLPPPTQSEGHSFFLAYLLTLYRTSSMIFNISGSKCGHPCLYTVTREKEVISSPFTYDASCRVFINDLFHPGKEISHSLRYYQIDTIGCLKIHLRICSNTVRRKTERSFLLSFDYW